MRCVAADYLQEGGFTGAVDTDQGDFFKTPDGAGYAGKDLFIRCIFQFVRFWRVPSGAAHRPPLRGGFGKAELHHLLIWRQDNPLDFFKFFDT